jgi:hypothetical protein
MEKLLTHRKERMFFMIINLLRMRPNIFMEQISAFKARCDLRQTAARGLLVFAPEDVDGAIEMLSNTQSTHLLELNLDLVDCCREARTQSATSVKKQHGEVTVHNSSSEGTRSKATSSIDH